MPVARTYLPLARAQVEQLISERELPSGLRGVAVGPGGGEEAEYAAWRAAAELGRAADARRVVASADLDLTALDPTPAALSTGVTTVAPVLLRRIVSFHVDEAIGSGDEDLLWFDVTELDAVLRLLQQP